MTTTIPLIDLTVAQLKKVAQHEKLAKEGKLSWIAFASKEELYSALYARNVVCATFTDETGNIVCAGIGGLIPEPKDKSLMGNVNSPIIAGFDPYKHGKEIEKAKIISQGKQIVETLKEINTLTEEINETMKPKTNTNDSLLDIIAKGLEGKIEANKVDLTGYAKEDYVKGYVETALKDFTPSIKEVHIKIADKVSHNAGLQHEKFEEILNFLSNGVHVMLVGESGSGKTHLAHALAKAMEKDFYSMSVCNQSTKGDIMGFTDANGTYRPSLYRRAYTSNSLFLGDEMDNGNSNTNNCFNASLENGICAFPDGMINVDKGFGMLAACNTFGLGADRQFVGRNQLDAAFLDRFAVVEFNIDENLEMGLASNKSWCKHVQSIRHAIRKEKIRMVCSMRATLKGSIMIAAGMQQDEVEKAFIFKGADQNTIEKIKANL